MRLLFVGNSQLGCLKRAWDEAPGALAGHDVAFYVFPGGEGPSFTFDQKRLLVARPGSTNPRFPPRAAPEAARERPVESYDTIVVSALGYVDGGFFYRNPLVLQGTLAACQPRPNKLTNRPLSQSCIRAVVRGGLANQHGFRFLRELRAVTDARIIVQPFPRMSEQVRDHPDWSLNLIYGDAASAHRIYSALTDEALADACADASAELLPHPSSAAGVDPLFTAAALMAPSDGLHPLPAYGRKVLDALAERLALPPPRSPAQRSAATTLHASSAGV